MDDTKNTNVLKKPKAPKQPRPPLTLRDMGEVPALMNTGDPRSGKRVRLTVLAFPFPPERQDEWADRHKFALDMNQDNRQFQTIMEVRSRLPRTCRLGLVPYNGKRNIGCTAIIVTSNATLVELERGTDLELIRAVQKPLRPFLIPSLYRLMSWNSMLNPPLFRSVKDCSGLWCMSSSRSLADNNHDDLSSLQKGCERFNLFLKEVWGPGSEAFGRIYDFGIYWYSVAGYILHGASTTADFSTTEETCYKDPFSCFTTPYHFFINHDNIPQSAHAKHRKQIHPPAIKTILREWRTGDVLFRLGKYHTLISMSALLLRPPPSAQHIHLEQHGYPPPTASAPRISMSPGHHHKPHPHTLPSSHSHLHCHQQHHPHHAHSHRPHSRSSSRSSSASLDVDEMLLEATTADAINGIAANQQSQQPPHIASLPLPTTTKSQNGSPHLWSHHSRRHAEEGSGRVHVYQGQQAQEVAGYAYPANQYIPRKDVGLQQQSGTQPGPLVQPGQVQQYQTHVFALVVMGAPMKKPKYSVSGSSIGGGGSVCALTARPGGIVGGPIDAPIVDPPAQVFPATNAQGHRISRQCGLPGRYKDNKCVEKWGPGPMGPGTVCDRCRKKMKHVERRGTLETQQQMAVMRQQQPSRGGSMSQLPLSQGSDRSIHRMDTVLTHHGSFSQPSQSQSQILGREPSQAQPHAQTQAPVRSSYLNDDYTTVFEEDEGEEEDAEHEREQKHEGEDGDSEQLPLLNVGRRSRAGVKKNGATAAGGKSSTGGRNTPAGGGGARPRVVEGEVPLS
ncbi:uncharacterized protein LACBIDRAFT_333064 [Laccaria bicolor S238N-H82]|uniref:Predicted protein n=1 Tax=Laccaria bicolor (strain S238N-H82 / ATCC MYA-4686) TaxID=486041 RepID=B0DUR3_LACBS|nr:uncharacterized protein LACBIDRAFT_333064 [Laccaria bicolor S238N-H82]EDR01656.1 predicted protein [Laccaria bicolor S238N-H82]|eukprot:XP_001887732.1 predicted protein [Laccaria bicolor S238N-H82]